jgi:hypothetical protein
MKTVLQFFREDNGNLSSTRLMAFEVVNAGLFISIYSVMANNLTVSIISLALSLVTLGFTGKLVQKPFENTPDQPPAPKV